MAEFDVRKRRRREKGVVVRQTDVCSEAQAVVCVDLSLHERKRSLE